MDAVILVLPTLIVSSKKVMRFATTVSNEEGGPRISSTRVSSSVLVLELLGKHTGHGISGSFVVGFAVGLWKLLTFWLTGHVHPHTGHGVKVFWKNAGSAN